MRKFLVIATIAAVLIMSMAAVASANHGTAATNTGGSSDPNASNYNPNYGVDNWGDRKKDNVSPGAYTNCIECHGDTGASQTSVTRPTAKGPHGGYTTSTNNCQSCHKIHLSKNESLLPGTTVVAVCNYCHDLTGSEQGPYNMLGFAQGRVKAAHRIAGLKVNTETTNIDQTAVSSTVYQSSNYAPSMENWTDTKKNWFTAAANAYNTIPGGDNATGANIAGDWSKDGGQSNNLAGNNFTCDSCHTPHALKGQSVMPYLGDSHVKTSEVTLYSASTGAPGLQTPTNLEGITYVLSNRLLRKAPNNITTNGGALVATEYGSAWCITCHKGRDNDPLANPMGKNFNHPVDETGKGYLYLDGVAGLKADLTAAGITFPATVMDDAPVSFKAVVDEALGTDYDMDTTGYGSYYTYSYKSSGAGYSAFAPNVVLKHDIRSNKYYAMTADEPLTGTPRLAGNYVDYATYAAQGGPACQQCHGNARDVEQLFAPGQGEPANMTFPHISANRALLTEYGDDFCTNCHGIDQLP